MACEYGCQVARLTFHRVRSCKRSRPQKDTAFSTVPLPGPSAVPTTSYNSPTFSEIRGGHRGIDWRSTCSSTV